MAGYATMKMPQLETAFYGAFDSYHRWKVAAAAWRAVGDKLRAAQDGMNKAWETAGVMQQNEQAGDSEAYYAFEDAIGQSHGSILGGNGGLGWAHFAREVGTRLDDTARIIADNQPYFESARSEFHAAEEGSAEREAALQRARLYVWNVANSVQLTFSGLQVPKAGFEGPVGSNGEGGAPGAGDPNAAGAADAGGAAGAGPGGAGPGGAGDAGGAGGQGDVGGPGEVPQNGAPPGAPGGAEPEDPLERAGKFIDVAGKGIDLLGKPADVAGKYIGLAEQLKGLGEGGAGDGLNPEDLFPDGKFPDYEPPDLPDNADEPSLAGGAAEAPTFRPPDLGAGAGGSGAGGGAGGPGGIGSVGVGSFGRAGGETSGGGGGAPSLAGQSSSGAAPSGRSGMPPMYPPPMGGMGAGAPGGQGNGQGGVKPGQAQSRGGFDVDKAQTTTEQLQRRGVQEDLQGRTNGERRPPSAERQRRKRKDRAGTGGQHEQGVLDEELWRP